MKELSKEQQEKFDAWCDGDEASGALGNAYRPTAKQAWQAALEANGLDSPNAVVINPDKLGWPENATMFEMVYWFYNGDKSVGIPAAVTIPRPAPAWEPEIDKVVFVNFLNTVTICRVVGVGTNGMFIVRDATGLDIKISLKFLKPFYASKIGFSWEEL